jgi:transposase
MALPKHYEIIDEQWAQIAPLFPPYRTGCPPKLTNRQAFNGVLWLLKSGAAWRDLPERYGVWKNVYSRFRLWADVGLFEKNV